MDKRQWKEYENLKEEFEKKKANQLKEMLQKNAISATGTKEVMANRCALNKVLGTVPNCPSCGG